MKNVKQNSILTSLKSNWKHMLMIAVLFSCLIIYIYTKEDVATIQKVLQNIDIKFMFLAVLFMVAYWVLEAMVLDVFAKSFYKKQKFKDSFKTSMVGQFFNSITPFSSGGQPLQALSMVKGGMPLGFATSSLLAKFIVYQVVLTLYCAVLLFLKMETFTRDVGGFQKLAFIGFAINVIVVIILFTVAKSSKSSKKIVDLILRKGEKIILFKKPLIKNAEEKREYLYEEIDNFNDNFKVIKTQKKTLLFGSIFTFLQLNASFFVPYCIYLSFGLPPQSILTFIAAQAFVQMISAFVPLPGGSGGAELSFLAFYKLLFPAQYITVAMLLWRVTTFYLTILVSVFFIGGVFVKNEKNQ